MSAAFAGSGYQIYAIMASSETLVDGIGLCSQPVAALLAAKAEPDEEEAQLTAELHAPRHNHTVLCKVGLNLLLL